MAHSTKTYKSGILHFPKKKSIYLGNVFAFRWEIRYVTLGALPTATNTSKSLPSFNESKYLFV